MCTTHNICQAVQTALAEAPDVTSVDKLTEIAEKAAFGNPDDDGIPRLDLQPVIRAYAQRVAEQRRRQQTVDGLRGATYAG